MHKQSSFLFFLLQFCTQVFASEAPASSADLYASEEYTHEVHQQIINPDSSLPPKSQPELRTLRGQAAVEDRSTWRTPLSHEPLEDCREHAARLSACRDREGYGSKDVDSVCQAERQNVMSCLRDPRSREYRFEASIQMRPSITVTPSLEDQREQCAREHLGFARHLCPEWIPVIAGQAAVERHAACVARAQYDEIELKERVHKEHEKQKSAIPTSDTACQRSDMDSDPGYPSGFVHSSISCPPGAVPPGIPNPKCKHQIEVDARTGRSYHEADCHWEDEPFLPAKDKVEAGRKRCALKPIVPYVPMSSPPLDSLSTKAPQSASSDKKPEVTKPQTKPTSIKEQISKPLSQEELQKKAYELKQANEQMQMALDTATKAEEVPAQSQERSVVLEPTGAGSFRAIIQSDRDAQFDKAMNRFGEIGDGIGAAISLLGDKHTGNAIKKATLGAVKMGMAFKKKDPFTFISGLADFIDAFDEADEVNQMILHEIYESIQALSRQMAQNHEQVMKRFDRVDKMLEHEQRLIIQGFFNLHKETRDIKGAVQKLGEQVAKQHEQLRANVGYTRELISSNHAMLADSLASLRIEDIHEIVENAKDDAERKELAARDFERHTKRLARKAITRAVEPHLTGGKVTITDASAIQTALKSPSKTLWAHPAFSNVNLLCNYATHRFKTKPTTLVNPLIWLQCADMTIQLFRKKLTDPSYPSNAEQQTQDRERLTKLCHEGTKIGEFIQELDKTGCVQDIAKDYIQKLQQLADIIKDRQIAYEVERTAELCEIHRKAAESEAMLVSTMPLDCPECVKLTLAAVQQFKNQLHHQHDYARTVDFIKTDPRTFMIFAGKKDEKLQSELLHSRKISDIIDPQARFKEIAREHTKNIQQNGLHMASRVTLEPSSTFSHSKQPRLIYPADPEQYSVRLLINNEQIPYVGCHYYEAEELGLGVLRYEYAIKNKTFYVYCYYCSKDGIKKKILTKQLPYEASSLYSNDENLMHFWYGGRYPKEVDTFAARGDWRTRGFQLINMGHYPGVDYPGIRDQFRSLMKRQTVADMAEYSDVVKEQAAARDLVKKQIATFYANERIKFCQQIAAEAEPSTKSKVFKTIQELDVQCKLLDSFLTFMYNELMYASPDTMHPQFAALHDTTVTYLKDEAAINKYFDEYAQPTSGLKECEFALHHIKQTQETIEKTFQGILGLKLKAGFAQIVNVLDGLREVMAVCQGRAITPIKIDTEMQELVLAIKELHQKHDKEVAQRDKQIALLAQDKETLTKVVTETRQEIQGMREQMKQLMEMLAKTQQRA